MTNVIGPRYQRGNPTIVKRASLPIELPTTVNAMRALRLAINLTAISIRIDADETSLARRASRIAGGPPRVSADYGSRHPREFYRRLEEASFQSVGQQEDLSAQVACRRRFGESPACSRSDREFNFERAGRKHGLHRTGRRGLGYGGSGCAFSRAARRDSGGQSSPHGAYRLQGENHATAVRQPVADRVGRRASQGRCQDAQHLPGLLKRIGQTKTARLAARRSVFRCRYSLRRRRLRRAVARVALEEQRLARHRRHHRGLERF